MMLKGLQMEPKWEFNRNKNIKGEKKQPEPTETPKQKTKHNVARYRIQTWFSAP